MEDRHRHARGYIIGGRQTQESQGRGDRRKSAQVILIMNDRQMKKDMQKLEASQMVDRHRIAEELMIHRLKMINGKQSQKKIDKRQVEGRYMLGRG